MMLTEEEAKTKRCCGPRHSGDVPFHASDAHQKDNPVLCIGSACMAWRWAEQLCTHKTKGGLHCTSVMRDGFSDKDKYELLPQKGYCGKAGAP